MRKQQGGQSARFHPTVSQCPLISCRPESRGIGESDRDHEKRPRKFYSQRATWGVVEECTSLQMVRSRFFPFLC